MLQQSGNNSNINIRCYWAPSGCEHSCFPQGEKACEIKATLQLYHGRLLSIYNTVWVSDRKILPNSGIGMHSNLNKDKKKKNSCHVLSEHHLMALKKEDTL